MGENNVCSFLWHLCMNVIMCKYLQAPNRNAGNLRSLCITLWWGYMFRCTEIKLCLGCSIMLFKRCNILSIWLRACTMLSSPLLFLSLSFFYTYNIIFFSSLILSQHPPRVRTNTQTSIPLWNYICSNVILFSVCL